MTKIYGPYTRRDGRQHLVIVTPDKKKTVSYPKWIMEQALNRELTQEETVDHIDGNPLNNEITNLQVVSRQENAKLWHTRNPAQYIILTCKYCGKQFSKRKKAEIYDRVIRKKDGPFCSKSCVGKAHH